MTHHVISIECNKCNSCGNVTLAPKKVCARCGGTGMETVQSPGKGAVIDFTTVYYPPDNYKDRAPYTSIFVKLENGCKLFGVIEGEVRDIPAGSRVSAVKHDEQTEGYIFELD